MKKYFYYDDEKLIHPLGEPKIELKAEDVFFVALKLIEQKLTQEPDLENDDYTLYFLIPGGEAAEVMSKLRIMVKRTFPKFQNASDDKIKFIREPEAAAAYTISSILAAGQKSYYITPKNKYSHFLTIDLGGGTTDFALVYLNNNSKVFPLVDTCIQGGTSVDDVFISFLDAVFSYKKHLGTAFYNTQLQKF